MKRNFLSALLTCTLILGSVLGLSACNNDESGETPKNPLIPQIPVGVNLTKVNEEDMTSTLANFKSNYLNSSDLIVQTYTSINETTPVGNNCNVNAGAETSQDLKYLKTADNIYGQNLTYDSYYHYIDGDNDNYYPKTYRNFYIENNIQSIYNKTDALDPTDNNSVYIPGVYRTSFTQTVTLNDITKYNHISYGLYGYLSSWYIGGQIEFFDESDLKYIKADYSDKQDFAAAIERYYFRIMAGNTEESLIQQIEGTLNGFLENGYADYEFKTEMYANETKLYFTTTRKVNVGCDVGDYTFKFFADDIIVKYVDIDARLNKNDFEIPYISENHKTTFNNLEAQAIAAQNGFAENKSVEIAPPTGELSEIHPKVYLTSNRSSFEAWTVTEIFNENYTVSDGKIIFTEGLYDKLITAADEWVTETQEEYDTLTLCISCKYNDYYVIIYLNA